MPSGYRDSNACKVLGGETASGWLTYTDRFVMQDGRLHRHTTVWAIGRAQEDDRYGAMTPDAQFIDRLFKRIPLDASGEGLGMFKTTFIVHNFPVHDLPRVNCITR